MKWPELSYHKVRGKSSKLLATHLAIKCGSILFKHYIIKLSIFTSSPFTIACSRFFLINLLAIAHVDSMPELYSGLYTGDQHCLSLRTTKMMRMSQPRLGGWLMTNIWVWVKLTSVTYLSKMLTRSKTNSKIGNQSFRRTEKAKRTSSEKLRPMIGT